MNTEIESEFAKIESITGLRLTESFRKIFLRLQGFAPRDPQRNIQLSYLDGFSTDDILLRFLTADDICGQWSHMSYLTDFAEHFQLGPEIVEPRYLMPFAETAAGCVYVAVGGRHVDSVYHSDNGDFGISRLSNRLDEFIRNLSL
jgi:hypothetical protein